MPVNFDLIASLKAAEGAAAQMAVLRLQVDEARAGHRQTAAQCAECDQPAAHFCAECGDDLCADHSRQVHALRKNREHAVVAIAEKATLLSAQAKRDALARAKGKENKCALHPTEVKYLYCSDCDEAICTACVHGRHAAHKKIEIAEAAAQARRVFADEMAKVTGSGARSGGGAGSVNAIGGCGNIGTLADAEKLGRQLREMKQGQRTDSAGPGQRVGEALSALHCSARLPPAASLTIALCLFFGLFLLLPFAPRRPLVVGRRASRRGVAGRRAEGRGGPSLRAARPAAAAAGGGRSQRGTLPARTRFRIGAGLC